MVNFKNGKTIFSGMQPSGKISLGNYLGALKNWVNLQEEYNCIFCCVNMHSLTSKIDPEILQKNSLDLINLYIACGIEPKKSIIYYQSHVHEHAELSWILNCYTYTGELKRMTQFKEKALKNPNNINGGLFTYPVLMAADILLYKTDLVPVGEDQKQHLELTRNIAERFNSLYGEVFKIPEPYINNIGAKIMSLQDPTKKMSKSDKKESTIFLTDTPDDIIKKIKKSVTDSENKIKFDMVNKPGVSNLLNIYSALHGISISESENYFSNKNYKDLKEITAESIIYLLKPIQEKFNYLSNNKDYVNKILQENKEKASCLAKNTLKNVYEKIGLI